MKIAIVSENRKFGNQHKDIAAVDFTNTIAYSSYLKEQGWGAVELLMLSYARGFWQNGHEVKLFTYGLTSTDQIKKTPALVQLIAKQRELFKQEMEAFQPEVALVMHTPNEFSLFPASVKRIFWQSHRECLMHPKLWDMNCIETHINTLNSISTDSRVKIAALSQDIVDIYEKVWPGVSKVCIVQDNPMDVSLFRHIPSGKPRQKKDISVMVAQIGPRKNQAAYSNIKNIHFIGPVYDGGFRNFPASKLMLDGRYLGPWTKDKIYDQLCEYGSAILLSTMEADNMSLKEAMSAGLAVVGHDATINKNIRGLPWVFNVTGKSNSYISDVIKEANVCTNYMSNDIRAWAEKTLETKYKSVELLQYL